MWDCRRKCVTVGIDNEILLLTTWESVFSKQPGEVKSALNQGAILSACLCFRWSSSLVSLPTPTGFLSASTSPQYSLSSSFFLLFYGPSSLKPLFLLIISSLGSWSTPSPHTYENWSLVCELLVFICLWLWNVLIHAIISSYTPFLQTPWFSSLSLNKTHYIPLKILWHLFVYVCVQVCVCMCRGTCVMMMVRG